MRKKITTLLTIILLTNIAFSQNTFDFRGHYDRLITPINQNPTYDGSGSNYQSNWYVSWGHYLTSLIRMYEATGDISYLENFAIHAHKIIFKQSSSVPSWYIPADQRWHYTGKLLKPMAEFVHLVVKSKDTQNDLYRTRIPSGTFANDKIENQVILGYGDFSNWLITRIVPTLDLMISDYWINYTLCFTYKYLSWWDKRYPKSSNSGVINMQADYASAMYYLHRLNYNHKDYKGRAEAIGRFFDKYLHRYEPNDTYTWFHNENWVGKTIYREDIAHSVPDLDVAILFSKYNTSIFNSTDMRRFARTFTYNVWGRTGYQGFRNNVYGMMIDNDPGDLCGGTVKVNETNNFFAPGEVLPWIKMYKYDDMTTYPNDIYTVITEHCQRLLTNTAIHLPENYCRQKATSNLSGALSKEGLAEVVKAQWEKNNWQPSYLRTSQTTTTTTTDPVVIEKPIKDLDDSDKYLKNAEYSVQDENIDYKKLEDNILIFPNPCVNFLKITLPNLGDEDMKYKLFDLNGKLLKEGEILELKENLVNVSGLSKGTYLCSVLAGNQPVKTLQFIKK